MANTIVYICIAVVFITILFLVAAIQNSVDESRLMGTPTIPRSNAVFTSLASTKIKATPEEVLAVITNFEGYDKWSTSFTNHHWHDLQLLYGHPGPGSTGTFQVRTFRYSFLSMLRIEALLCFSRNVWHVSSVSSDY